MPRSLSGRSVSSFSSARSRESAVSRLDDVGRSELMSVGESIDNALFGVLFTVVKERYNTGLRFLFAKLALDFVQLFTVVFRPSDGWVINRDVWIWRMIQLLQFEDFLRPRGYSIFLAALYTMVGLLVVAIVLAVWTAWCFQNRSFPAVWPIKLLRVYANIFFQTLDVATLTLLQLPFDCRWLGYPDAERNHFALFPSYLCTSLPHVAHMAASGVALVIYLVMAGLNLMADFELNPTTRNLYATANSTVEVRAFGVKFLMTVCTYALGWKKLRDILLLLLAAYHTWLYLKWEPHLFGWVNHLRVGLNSAITITALGACILVFSREDDVAYHKRVTVIILAMLGPSMIIGGLASYVRLTWWSKFVLMRYRNAPAGQKARRIYKFTNSHEVEIVARVCRAWTDAHYEVLDRQAAKMAEIIIKGGMQLFPNNAYILILYSNLLIDVMESVQTGYSQLHAAKQYNPSLMERFAIFVREQEQMQRSTGANSGESSVDLVSYVEYQRNHRMVIRAHRNALVAIRNFWQLLLHNKVSFASLAKALMRIEKSVSVAEDVYKVALVRYPASPKLLRGYGKFLETVKNNPWRAAKYLSEAEKLREAQEQDEATMAVMGGEEGGGSHLLNRVDEHVSVVFLINSAGIIQMANKNACSLLGYGKGELDGKNINIIMPPPFSQRHNRYIRQYIQTGRERVISSVNTVVALHKARYVLPVKLAVSKVSGATDDSIFMGVLEPLSVDLDEAHLYLLPNGTVTAMDQHFAEWLGLDLADIMGKDITSLVEQAGAKAIKSVLPAFDSATRKHTVDGMLTGQQQGGSSLSQHPLFNPAGATGAASLHPSSSMTHTLTTDILCESIPSVMFFHKHSQPVECSVALQRLGIGPVECMVELKLRRLGKPQLLIMAGRNGRIKYISRELAHTLGTTPSALAKQPLGDIMPQPWGTMHEEWLKSTVLGSSGSGLVIPPGSCRTGMAMVLGSSHRAQGYYRLGINSSDESGGVQHVVHVNPSSREEALAERRLVLTVDADGIITDVENAPTWLFGFPPEQLLGRSLADCVPTLRPDVRAAGPAGGTGGAEDGAPYEGEPGLSVTDMLALLMSRAMTHSGSSWRVGVSPPMDEEELAALGPMRDAVLSKRTVPAIMEMEVSLDTEAIGAPSGFDPRLGSPRLGEEQADGGHLRGGSSSSQLDLQQRLAGRDSSPHTTAPATISSPGGRDSPVSGSGRVASMPGAAPRARRSSWIAVEAPGGGIMVVSGAAAGSHRASILGATSNMVLPAEDTATYRRAVQSMDASAGPRLPRVQRMGLSLYGGDGSADVATISATAHLSRLGSINVPEPSASPELQAGGTVSVRVSAVAAVDEDVDDTREVEAVSSRRIPGLEEWSSSDENETGIRNLRISASRALAPTGDMAAEQLPQALATSFSSKRGGSNAVTSNAPALPAPGHAAGRPGAQGAASTSLCSPITTPGTPTRRTSPLSAPSTREPTATGIEVIRHAGFQQASDPAALLLSSLFDTQNSMQGPGAGPLVPMLFGADPGSHQLIDAALISQLLNGGEDAEAQRAALAALAAKKRASGRALVLKRSNSRKAASPNAGNDAVVAEAGDSDVKEDDENLLPDVPDDARVVVLRVTLWRADLLTPVLEVDNNNNITSMVGEELAPPGLLFGLPTSSLLSRPLPSLLELQDRSVAGLFHDPGTTKRGGLKTAAKRSNKLGTLRTITARHVDQQPLQLSLQAVVREAAPNRTYVVLKSRPFKGSYEALLASVQSQVSLLRGSATNLAESAPGCDKEDGCVGVPSKHNVDGYAGVPSKHNVDGERPHGRPASPSAAVSSSPAIRHTALLRRSFDSVGDVGSGALSVPPGAGQQGSAVGASTADRPRADFPGCGDPGVQVSRDCYMEDPRAAVRASPNAGEGLGDLGDASPRSSADLGSSLQGPHPFGLSEGHGAAAGGVCTSRAASAGQPLGLVPDLTNSTSHRGDLQPRVSNVYRGGEREAPSVEPSPLRRRESSSSTANVVPGKGGLVNELGDTDPRQTSFTTVTSETTNNDDKQTEGGAALVRKGAAWAGHEEGPQAAGSSDDSLSHSSLSEGSVDNEQLPSGLAPTLPKSLSNKLSSMDLLQSPSLRTGPSMPAAGVITAAYPAKGAEVEGAPDKEDGDIDDGASDMSGMSGMSGVSEAMDGSGPQTDYRRGKRYKKLLRVLESPVVQRAAIKFQWQAPLANVAQLLTNLVAFIILTVMLHSQLADIDNLNRSSLSARLMHKMFIDMQVLNNIHEGKLPDSEFYTAADTPTISQDFLSRLDLLSSLHASAMTASVYERPDLSTPYNRELETDVWKKPVHNETVFYNTQPYRIEYVNTSLWDLGNRFIERAAEVQHMHDKWGPEHGTLRDMDAYKYCMTNGLWPLYEGYSHAMTAMTHSAVQAANKLNALQLVLLVLQGGAVCVLLLVYMWWLQRRVSQQRYGMYSLFMLVPVGLLRGLASKSVNISDNSDGEASSDDEHDHQQQHGPNHVHQQHEELTASKSFTLSGSVSRPPGVLPGLNRLMAWNKPSARTDPKRRQLVPSNHEATYLLAPFVVWGILICVLYTTGYVMLSNIELPLSLMSAQNLAVVRVHRMMLFALQIGSTGALESVTELQPVLRNEVLELEREWHVLLYGANATMQNDPRFTMCTEGTTHLDSTLSWELFRLDGCLMSSASVASGSSCPTRSSPFYAAVTHGVSSMIERLMEDAYYLVNLPPAQLGINNAHLRYIMEAGQGNIEVGMDAISEALLGDVRGLYHSVGLLQIFSLVLSWLLAVAFIFLQLRPAVLRNRLETQRIARMLSELPADVDVEGMVTRAMLRDTEKRNGHGSASGYHGAGGISAAWRQAPKKAP